MKGDSMKSYEVYEATLTFNDENEEVNTDNTKNSYSDPELILVFFLCYCSEVKRTERKAVVLTVDTMRAVLLSSLS